MCMSMISQNSFIIGTLRKTESYKPWIDTIFDGRDEHTRGKPTARHKNNNSLRSPTLSHTYHSPRASLYLRKRNSRQIDATQESQEGKLATSRPGGLPHRSPSRRCTPAPRESVRRRRPDRCSQASTVSPAPPM